MHPMIRPGSFVQIDEGRRHIKNDDTTNELDKAVYFLEHRAGFRCGWCTLRQGLLMVQSRPASSVAPEVYKYPGEVEIFRRVLFGTGYASRSGEATPYTFLSRPRIASKSEMCRCRSGPQIAAGTKFLYGVKLRNSISIQMSTWSILAVYNSTSAFLRSSE